MRFCCRRFVKAVRDGMITIGDESHDTLAKPNVEMSIILSGDFCMSHSYCPFCGRKITFEFEEDDRHEQ